MEIICILLMISNTVFAYHFYNPVTHDLLERTSLNNVPKGYRLLPPPRGYRRMRPGVSKGRCSDPGFKCSTPYDRPLTFQFECTSDDQCPSGYKCCSQKCFVHKICVRAEFTQINRNENKSTCKRQRPGACEQWPYNCQRPYDYSYTYLFKCDRDSQCPKYFKCCQQSCFSHKICSRIVSQTKQTTEKVFTTERNFDEQEEDEKYLVTEVNEDQDEEDNEDGAVEENEAVTTENNIEYEDETIDNENDGDDEEETTTTKEAADEENLKNNEETTTTEETVDSEDSTTNKEEVTIPETESIEDTGNDTEEDIATTPTIEYTEEDRDDIVENEEGDDSVTLDKKNGVNNSTETGFENTSKRTTLDSNAISPDYAEYYYHYDNNTDNKTEDEEYDDVEDYNYDDEEGK